VGEGTEYCWGTHALEATQRPIHISKAPMRGLLGAKVLFGDGIDILLDQGCQPACKETGWNTC